MRVYSYLNALALLLMYLHIKQKVAWRTSVIHTYMLMLFVVVGVVIVRYCEVQVVDNSERALALEPHARPIKPLEVPHRRTTA